MMSDRPKQYLPLMNQRVLDFTLHALCASDSLDGVIVGIRQGDRWWQAQPFEHPKLIAVSQGGEQRVHTVLNALQQLLQDKFAVADDWVMVHDAVRPCVTLLDIERLVAAANSSGTGAILTLRLVDTLKQIDDQGFIEKTLGRDLYWRALTPQIFRCEQLRVALQHALDQGFVPTDESSAMEMMGIKPVPVESHPANIKITVAADLELASLYLTHTVARIIHEGSGLAGSDN